MKMKEIKRKISNQYTQPSLPFNSKTHQIDLSSRKRYLNSSNSNSKSFKKQQTQTSAKRNQIQRKFKYANSSQFQASLQKSIVKSYNNLGQLFMKGQFQNISATINQSKFQSRFIKEDREQKGAKKVNSTNPFDAQSGFTQKTAKQRSGEYYLYWKGKAHEYQQSNMKLLNDIRKLTHQNDKLKQRIQQFQQNAEPIKKEINNSYLNNQSKNRQQKQSNSYLLQKIEELQSELKKKAIAVKFYQQKIIDLNSRILNDNQRSKLINKLKSQIDDLKLQLNKQSTKSNSIAIQEKLLEEKMRNPSESGYFKGPSFDRR